jgi:hypothetical protein
VELPALGKKLSLLNSDRQPTKKGRLTNLKPVVFSLIETISLRDRVAV